VKLELTYSNTWNPVKIAAKAIVRRIAQIAATLFPAVIA